MIAPFYFFNKCPINTMEDNFSKFTMINIQILHFRDEIIDKVPGLALVQ